MKADRPLISVIVPVCNGQDYLEKCILSVEDQSYENLEVIIVNNGSTDETGAVSDRLAADYDNITVLTLENEGVSVARNTGIDAANGELLTFVDADDRLCPDALQILYDCMVNTESDVSGCAFFMWSSEEEWKQSISAERIVGQTATYNAGQYLKEAILHGNSRCWSKLYKREIFDKVRFPENLTIGEDMLFLVRMLPFAEKISETDYQGYGYFQNPLGAINRGFTPRYMDQIICWQLAREEILRMDESLNAQVTALYMMGIMLTVGKLAMLSAADRQGLGMYTRTCHERLKETMRVPGAYIRLSAGYRIKTGIFLFCPNVYLFLYHLLKAVH